MEATLEQCLVLNAPEWFQDAEFVRFLDSPHSTTWHVKGEVPSEYSDLFVTYDHGDSNDYQPGSDLPSIPEHIWDQIVAKADELGFTYGVIWIQNF